MASRLGRKGLLGSNDFNLVGRLYSHSSVPKEQPCGGLTAVKKETLKVTAK